MSELVPHKEDVEAQERRRAVGEHPIWRCPECGRTEEGTLTTYSITCYGRPPKQGHESAAMVAYIPLEECEERERKLREYCEFLERNLTRSVDEFRRAVDAFVLIGRERPPEHVFEEHRKLWAERFSTSPDTRT